MAGGSEAPDIIHGLTDPVFRHRSRHVIGRFPDFRFSISHGNAQAGPPDHGQIIVAISHGSALFPGNAETGQDTPDTIFLAAVC